MRISLLTLTIWLSACSTFKNKDSYNDTKSKSDMKAPSLTSPKVTRVWVPDKIEGDKYIEGHWVWVLERGSTWSQ